MRYPLHKFGIELGAPEVGPLAAIEYRIDPERVYDVIDWDSDARRTIGHGKVSGGGESFVLEPDFTPDGTVVFWAEWDVDREGIARLMRVVQAMELDPQ